MKQVYDFFLKGKDINYIPHDLYTYHSVKKGLRNEDGTGVLVGLTKISDVVGYKRVDGEKVDDFGSLYYRGININDIISRYGNERYLFERVCFLILFGYLPDNTQFNEFKSLLANNYELPSQFLQQVLLGLPSQHLMNKLQQVILMMYNYDDHPDDTGVEETLTKGIHILSKIPSLITYSYHCKKHHYDHQSLVIHQPRTDYSIAEMILYLLRDDGNFTKKEAEVLDVSLLLHADHGGGNNSTFTNVVISSTGTDLYSTIAGSIGSLKGPRHGGANLKVKGQMDKVINDIGIDASDEQINAVISNILDKNYNDNSGLIYGIGHAVYTLSDPRSVILKQQCKELAIEKNRLKEFEFYEKFEKAAVEEIKRRKNKNVCTNVDFYSGFVYDMLGIPQEMYTLLFVMGRTVGWIAHNVENKLYSNKIIRPATQYVGEKNTNF